MAEGVNTYITSGRGCICALGNNVHDAMANLLDNRSGIQKTHFADIPETLALGKIDQALLNKESQRSWFEQIVIASIEEALSKVELDVQSDRTLFILSTTKGNIDWIEHNRERSYLTSSADIVKKHFGLVHQPLVLSIACISGVASLLWGHRLIQEGRFDHVVVCGADVLSKFVVSGFMSFKALSPDMCKPHDQDRIGLNLGEAAATLILSSKAKSNFCIKGGSTANDANHISGPSRTGEGLFRASSQALEGDFVDYISAHGTATPYNDAMEVQAFNRLGAADVPVNSFKAYIGHTLGAAGVIETLFALESAEQDVLIQSLGYHKDAEEHSLNIITENRKNKINSFLKTASGFGGTNAALLVQRIHD